MEWLDATSEMGRKVTASGSEWTAEHIAGGRKALGPSGRCQSLVNSFLGPGTVTVQDQD